MRVEFGSHGSAPNAVPFSSPGMHVHVVRQNPHPVRLTQAYGSCAVQSIENHGAAGPREVAGAASSRMMRADAVSDLPSIGKSTHTLYLATPCGRPREAYDSPHLFSLCSYPFVFWPCAAPARSARADGASATPSHVGAVMAPKRNQLRIQRRIRFSGITGRRCVFCPREDPERPRVHHLISRRQERARACVARVAATPAAPAHGRRARSDGANAASCVAIHRPVRCPTARAR